VGTHTSHHKSSGAIILLMVAGHYESLERLLLTRGYTVVVPPTSDQAVAVCLHNRIAAVLIDEGTATDVEEWSLARSLKAVSPNTPVLLLVRDPSAHRNLPPGVDCIVSESEPSQVLQALRDCAA
jgi:DNA-binding NarL/FixJ family response regulator